MKAIVILPLLLFRFFALAQPFQLAPPQTGVGVLQSPFFTDSMVVTLRFDLQGAYIRYSLDGTLPGPGAAIFEDNITIRSSCTLTAISVHPDFLDSDPVSVQLVRLNPEFEPEQAVLTHPPAEKYRGKGAATLHDRDKGHEQPDSGCWLGFEGGNLDYTMSFSRKIAPKRLMVSILSAPASWILPPRRIELWASTGKKGTFEKVASLDIPPVQQSEKGMAERLYFLDLKPVKARHWRVVAHNGGPLPDWHPGKGKPAWLFVDEVAFQ